VGTLLVKRIYRTINGGNSWEQNTNQNKRYYSLFFTDYLTGYVCGIIVGNLVGIIQKTTSGGNSWQNVHQTQGSCESIYFVTTDTGYYVGLYVDPSYYSNPVTYKTTDVGELWNYLSNGAGALHDKWNAVYFTDPNIGFIVGNKGIANNGIILKTVDGGDSWNEVTSIQVIKSDVITISKYKLHQNYPNPFNPNTTIKYQIPEISFVTIKVYDVLGKEVATLVNEEKPAGNYDIEFDGEGITSGIYFYQLQAGSFVETKKMIMIK
jgi:photosystem II stability/assembly factor-like uncharacterized protein